MAQDKIKINGTEICQPDEGLGWSMETTYTSDSTRVQSGKGRFTPMFTVEQLAYTATDVSAEDCKAILQKIAEGKNFTLHYFSPYYGVWRDDTFYVGKGDCKVQTLQEGNETLSDLSFNMTGVNPI